MTTFQSTVGTVLSDTQIIENVLNADMRVLELMQSTVSGPSSPSTSRLDKYTPDFGHGVPLWEARWFSKQQPSAHV